MSYRGHKPIITEKELCKFWKWMSKFWKEAIKVGIWEKKHEEDLVGWVGGIAAWVTALSPTTICLGTNCLPDWKSNVHYIGAVILFSTTVYFCLVAFLGQVKAKIKEDEVNGLTGNSPKKRRRNVYLFCGWGIALVMVGLLVVKVIKFGAIPNLTFWVETLALELFGFAWAVSSQYLPIVTDKSERQKLF